jgi:hypothetical protein
MDGNGNGVQAPSTLITVTVTFDPATRMVGLNAPVSDEMVLLYMLEKARDAIKDLVKEQAKGQRIVPATEMPFIRH